mmetsp:Transcript_20669/g.45899  ORF Transcript_20669/g.45899 Transcript_20669/m.45899 type:complete len:97 (-) Transcript_20669:433-723(-)
MRRLVSSFTSLWIELRQDDNRLSLLIFWLITLKYAKNASIDGGFALADESKICESGTEHYLKAPDAPERPSNWPRDSSPAVLYARNLGPNSVTVRR